METSTKNIVKRLEYIKRLVRQHKTERLFIIEEIERLIKKLEKRK